MMNDATTEMYVKLSRNDFSKLYNTHKEFLFKMLIGMGGSQELVEDIIHEVFLRIWLLREKIKPNASLRSYMFRIGQNLIVDYYRKIDNERYFESTYHSWFETSYLINLDKIFNEDKISKIKFIIDKLPPKRKKIYELCKFEEKSYTEVSELLCISLSTISDHMVKANRFIKAELKS
ncbi:MAG TPA: sigma-70 family RNA polymerase sigma factor [Sphingobacterium sp.]|nr:sigma-70 family RNA polymerase sigma factor [Sphingobacterium sp.]